MIFFILPMSLFLSAVLMIPARHFRLVPSGVSAWIPFPLLALLLAGAVGSVLVLERLAVRPIQLHQQYLGRSYASPLRLRYFEEGGFQDPYEIWKHDLTQSEAAELRGRCKRYQVPPLWRTNGCSLYGEMDERWYIDIALEGEVLVVNEGLH